MKLLNPNPGECVDRQTILELKMEAIEKMPHDIIGMGISPIRTMQPQFTDEHRGIQKYLYEGWLLLVPKTVGVAFNELAAQLKACNRQLWGLQEEIRSLRDRFDKTEAPADIEFLVPIRDATFAMLDASNTRARLVQKINELFGIHSLEKLYPIL